LVDQARQVGLGRASEAAITRRLSFTATTALATFVDGATAGSGLEFRAPVRDGPGYRGISKANDGLRRHCLSPGRGESACCAIWGGIPGASRIVTAWAGESGRGCRGLNNLRGPFFGFDNERGTWTWLVLSIVRWSQDIRSWLRDFRMNGIGSALWASELVRGSSAPAQKHANGTFTEVRPRCAGGLSCGVVNSGHPASDVPSRLGCAGRSIF